MRSDDTDRSMASHQMGKAFEWDKWRKEIPYIKFDPDCKVQVIPPFGRAVIRFVVSDGENTISVYLDCYDELGSMAHHIGRYTPLPMGMLRDIPSMRLRI